MIRYSPPKSQVWGHQLGRLSAVCAVERALQFLNDQCIILESPPSELMVSWKSARHSLIREVAGEIDQTLGQPIAVIDLPGTGGHVSHQRRWQFSADRLALVATWFDKFAVLLKEQDVVAHSSTFWTFAWDEEPGPLHSLQSPGGVFGIHLSRPHRISTMFSFRDLEQYLIIKEYLGKIELAQLSDRHLRPKTSAGASKRRATN